MQAFLRSAARVIPSERQMAWFDTEFYAFFHFGMNTFTGREWGEGTESPALSNPPIKNRSGGLGLLPCPTPCSPLTPRAVLPAAGHTRSAS